MLGEGPLATQRPRDESKEGRPHAKNVGATGSKLKEVHEQELGRCVSEIAILIDGLKDVTVTKKSALYVHDKVDLLEKTSKTIQESKDIMAVLAKCTPGLSTGSVAKGSVAKGSVALLRT